MRALLSLIAGSLLLNLSAHAVSNSFEKEKSTTTGGLKALDEDFEVPKNPRAWEKQEMDDEGESHKRSQSRGFEKQPQDYENQPLEN